MTVTTSVPEAPRPNARETRALELYRSRGPEIVCVAGEADVYLVPSQDGRRVYRVVYGEVESCSCPDHQYRGLNCAHIYAVGISLAKRRRPCACNSGWVTIGQLVADPETGEETEDFALYLCRRCADSR
jgi:hypothetical protein